MTSSGACSNCGAESTGLRRRWCRPCYLRWFKAGKPESGPPPRKNDALAQWRTVPVVAIARTPTDLDVGTAGEHLVCADLLLAGFTAFRTDQNCPYDVAVDLGGRLVRLQVKSTREPRPIGQRREPVLAYHFHVRRAGKGGRRKYGVDDFDLLALVGLDVRQVAYMPPSQTRTLIHVRPPDSDLGKQFADYPFARALHEIGLGA